MRRHAHAVRPLYAIGALLAATLALNGGCRPGGAGPQPLPADSVLILAPALTNAACAMALQVARDTFRGALVVPMESAVDAGRAALQSRRVLVVPAVEYFPVDAWPVLEDLIAAGGPVLFFGRDPFAARVFQADGAWHTQAELYAQVIAAASADNSLPSVQTWRHGNDSGRLRGAVKVAHGAGLPWPGVAVEVEDFEQWDTLTLDAVPPGTIHGAPNSIAFHCRGDGQTTRLFLRVVERDGAAWFHTVALTRDWQAHIVHERAFAYAGGGANRGAADDHFSLTNLAAVTAGLSQEYGPQSPGAHQFALSDLRLVKDPRPPWQIVGWPAIPILGTPAARVEFACRRIRLAGEKSATFAGIQPLQGPLPGPSGLGGALGARARLLPLATALDAHDQPVGAPASVCVTVATGGIASAIGWVGVNPVRGARQAAGRMLAACAQRLLNGCFLYAAGSPAFSLAPGEMIRVGARWTTTRVAPAPARIMAELVAPPNRTERRVVSAPGPPGTAVELTLGPAPEVIGSPQEYRLRVVLQDARGQNETLDVLEQPLKIIPPRGPPAPYETISALGPGFRFGHQPAFLLGGDYEPARADREPFFPGRRGWLDPAWFDPETIRRDLECLSQTGVNALYLTCRSEAEIPQLRFVLDECARRKIGVILHLTALQPRAPQLERAAQWCAAARLATEPAVFAMDLTGSPGPARDETLRRLDRDWRAWLREQYGTAERAEQLLGGPLWRSGGKLCAPGVAELQSGRGRGYALAVYRRFLDDWFSRQVGYLKRFILAAGLRQMIATRFEIPDPANPGGGTLLMDPALGGAHADFTIADIREWPPVAARLPQLGFVAAYTRGFNGGRPVAFSGARCSPGTAPQPGNLQAQADFFAQFFAVLPACGVGAGLGDWADGDGLLNADGSLRPAAERFRELAHRTRGKELFPRPWRGREIDRYSEAAGFAALLHQWGPKYAREMAAGEPPELRPTAFAKPTTIMPLESIGGTPFRNPAPLAHANAEWGWIEIEGRATNRAPGATVSVPMGKKLSLELINTGAAAFAGAEEKKNRTVWIKADHDQHPAAWIPVNPLPPGRSTRVAWQAPAPGRWRLRPWLLNTGGFGELLELVAE